MCRSSTASVKSIVKMKRIGNIYGAARRLTADARPEGILAAMRSMALDVLTNTTPSHRGLCRLICVLSP
jgi:hypothetical protein